MNLPEQKELDRIRNEWFKDHHYEFRGLNSVRWGGKSSNYSVHYVIYGSVLFVCGDLGEAVYCWSSNITWEFLAGLDLVYFHSKCQASESGRQFYVFDATLFNRNLRAEIAPKYRHLIIDEEVGNEHEATLLIGKLYEQCDLDGETLGSFMEGGRVLNLRCCAHLIGLQMLRPMMQKPLPHCIAPSCL